MPSFQPFVMERWQSLHENRVEFNLSESGVHPLTVGDLLGLAGASIDDLGIGYGQSNGSDVLRQRIAALYPDPGDDAVVVMNGSAEANFAVMWELVSTGDAVAVLAPTYMQTPGLARTVGADVRWVPLRETLGWQPDPDEIRAIDARTRLIIVTNPGNPTGAILQDAARDAVIDAAERTGAWILADEVYTGAELEGPETPSFFGRHPRVVGTGSLSKAYGLPGLRVGWAVAPPELAASLWARSDYTTISPGALTDHLAALALRSDVRPRILERTRRLLHEGLGILESWFRETGGFTWRRPDAGAICFARYHLDIDSDRLAETLRADYSVLVVPGAHFDRDRFLRIGFGEPAHLGPALERVGAALAAIGAGH
jgi:aspartate/methionine/tyrosine aminotransferase